MVESPPDDPMLLPFICWHELIEAAMLTLESNLFLSIRQLDHGPHPLPLQSGFNTHTVYRALGMFNPSETSDAYFILSNDRDEIWFICNRHLRTVASLSDVLDFRLPITTFAPTANGAMGAGTRPVLCGVPPLMGSESAVTTGVHA